MNRLDPQTFPLTGHRLIEASAGTGKTYTITNLYLRLLLGRDDSVDRALTVDQILVLTFTIAATEELRARIRGRIGEARKAFAAGESDDPLLHWLIAESKDPPRDARLLAGAVQLMDEASIFTIHGFCARVLSDNAFETGMLFDQVLDADRDELLEQAVRDCFRADILALPPMQRRMALNQWASPDALSRAIKPFLFRDRLEMVPASQPIDEDRLIEHFERLKAAWLDEDFARVAADGRFNRGTNVVRKLDDMTEWCRSDSLDTELLEHWCTATLEKRLNKGQQLPDSDVPGLIDGILDARSQVSTNLWHLTTARVRTWLDRYKAEQSKLTLDDLLTRVRDAQQSPGGEALSQNLAARWPVALVDEFQDTDDIQWDIFSHVWRDRGQGLFLIGDPKQAIYQFRGADVFTYINAKRAIPDHYSLDTNWRSRPALIDAVNTMFDQPAVFGNDRDIPFEPVEPSPRSRDRTISEAGHDIAPVTIVSLPADGANKQRMRRLTMGWAAEEISMLLSGHRGRVDIDGEPLHAGQIAILVRDRHDAKAAREALAARNIRSVYVTLESVFLTETAEDLRQILHAVLEPTNESALRAAVATTLMQCTAAEIDAMNNDLDAQQHAIEEFSDYHRLWADMDVATMIEALLARRWIAQKWFARQDGERQMTNLRHLTELLQQRASVAPGMHRLFKWFTREKREANTVAMEERQLRLESDRDLVKIVTMHAAKGLEYEIVMVPMASFASPARSSEPNLFHEERQQRFATLLDVGGDPEATRISQEEQRAEDMRLLYVAITRAKHKCYLGVAEVDTLKRSALRQLLRLGDDKGDAITDSLRARWTAPLFEVIAAPAEPAVTPWVVSRRDKDLVPPREAPTISSDWRVHSYTGVSRLVAAGSTSGRDTELPGFSDDDEASTTATGSRFTRFAFPRGPRVGVALHTLMEDLDFSQPAHDQPALLAQCLDRVGLTRDRDEWTDMLARWVDDIRSTPIDGFALQDLTRERQLMEMEFHFPLAATGNVFDVLQSTGYCRGLALSQNRLAGMMTGMIDLVFEHEGRFWLVDYKSNHLGSDFEDYEQDRMSAAIDHHLYDLQYLIYSVALDRYLASRVPDYAFERHVGGVAYLFLRGMRGAGSTTGVFVDRPGLDVVTALGEALSGRRVA